MPPVVKICGLKTPEAIQAAKGADYFGFIFFPPSVRNISLEEAARIKKYATGKTVAVTVNPDDKLLARIFDMFAPDYIQLHGNEPPERIREIKNKFFLPVIKAFNIKTAKDLEAVENYEGVSDILLFDAKSDKGLHGGTGIAFDWQILAGKTFKKPYFLSGGLNTHNIADALRISGAQMVDVSSGLESSPGNKDPLLISEFIKKVKSL